MPAPSTATTSPSLMPGAQDGMHGAGHRFGGDGVGVAEPVGYGEQLARVCHQTGRRPSAAGVGAEAGLQAGPDVPEGEMAAVTDVPGLRMPRTDGWMPRAAQPRTGWSTTRVPAARTEPSAPTASAESSPTTSCPGTKGNETISSK